MGDDERAKDKKKAHRARQSGKSFLIIFFFKKKISPNLKIFFFFSKV